jgi:hypothetical protein
MPLPDLNVSGELPTGVHRAMLDEVIQRFGSAGGQRRVCTLRLCHVYELAKRTGLLQQFVIFGSYVTAQANPNDIDVILVMDDAFRLEECPIEARGLFDHAVVQARYGASVFRLRPGLMTGESVDDFIAYWQLKRDGSRRGIVEVIL